MPEDDFAPNPSKEPLLNQNSYTKPRNYSVKTNSKGSSSNHKGIILMAKSSDSPAVQSNPVDYLSSAGRGLSSDRVNKDT